MMKNIRYILLPLLFLKKLIFYIDQKGKLLYDRKTRSYWERVKQPTKKEIYDYETALYANKLRKEKMFQDNPNWLRKYGLEEEYEVPPPPLKKEVSEADENVRGFYLLLDCIFHSIRFLYFVSVFILPSILIYRLVGNNWSFLITFFFASLWFAILSEEKLWHRVK